MRRQHVHRTADTEKLPQCSHKDTDTVLIQMHYHSISIATKKKPTDAIPSVEQGKRERSAEVWKNAVWKIVCDTHLSSVFYESVK